MPKKPNDREISIICKIEDIRKSNNFLWMDILRIALKADPIETKLVLREINGNDNQISKLMGKLSK